MRDAPTETLTAMARALAWQLSYRSRRLMDVPGIIRHLKFKRLRERYYAALWESAAHNIGAKFEPWRSGFSRISRDGKTTLVRHGEVMMDDHLTLELMGNKSLVYELLQEQGYLVPAHIRFSMQTIARAETFLRGRRQAIVVKPASGTGGGRGVTTGVTDPGALRKAARLGARFDASLIAEQQISGASYRLLYLGGRFIDAVRRDPPVVVGDGKKTLRQLIADENERRLSGPPFVALSPITIDCDCRNWLSARGLRLGTRPDRDQQIQVKHASNENTAAQNHLVREQVHPQIVAQGARLAQDFGIAFAGIDVLCRDITQPLGPENGLISEINTTPGIHHHYLVCEQDKSTPVAEVVLEYIFRTGRGVIRLDTQMENLGPSAEATYASQEHAA